MNEHKQRGMPKICQRKYKTPFNVHAHFYELFPDLEDALIQGSDQRDACHRGLKITNILLGGLV